MSARLFWNVRTGRVQTCRLDETRLAAFYDDPITHASGVAGDVVNDWRKHDLRDGCPFCRQDVAENASEPDVLARWELK